MIESRDGRRVVVTGVGVLAPCGIGAADFWAGLAKPAEPSVERRVVDFDPAAIGLSKVEVRRLDRFAQFALAAADEALRDANLLDAIDDDRTGVLIGSGIGGALTWEQSVGTLNE